jgi:hypothetical protein
MVANSLKPVRYPFSSVTRAMRSVVVVSIDCSLGGAMRGGVGKVDVCVAIISAVEKFDICVVIPFPRNSSGRGSWFVYKSRRNEVL